MTPAKPASILARTFASIGIWRIACGAKVCTTLPFVSCTSSPTCGFHSVPPFANAAYAFASCNGVTAIPPWPTAMRMSSAGYHARSLASASAVGQILLASACFHSGSGTVPVASSSSTPVGAPNPNSCAVVCRPRPRSLSPAFHACQNVVAGRVEVHVARAGDRALELDPSERSLTRVPEPAFVLAELDEALVVDPCRSAPRIPYCVIAIELTSLKVEPGAYTPWVARSTSGWSGLSFSAFHSRLADAVDERADVVVGERRHRDDRAVGDVHRDDRARRRLQRLEALALDVLVLLLARQTRCPAASAFSAAYCQFASIVSTTSSPIVPRLHVERAPTGCAGRVDLDLLAPRRARAAPSRTRARRRPCRSRRLLGSPRRAGVASCSSEISPVYPRTCAASSPCG